MWQLPNHGNDMQFMVLWFFVSAFCGCLWCYLNFGLCALVHSVRSISAYCIASVFYWIWMILHWCCISALVLFTFIDALVLFLVHSVRSISLYCIGSVSLQRNSKPCYIAHEPKQNLLYEIGSTDFNHSKKNTSFGSIIV